MASIGAAIPLLLKHEGGYVNNPNDPGGPTNYGITQAVYSAFLGQAATADDVKRMSVDTAKLIYRGYWLSDALLCQDVATWLFDMAVLRGRLAAVKSAQSVVGVTQDGVFGPKTLAAINAVPCTVFLNAFRSACIKAFAAIVTARPASVEFLKTWVSRAEEMALVVNELTQRTQPQAPAGPAPLPGA